MLASCELHRLPSRIISNTAGKQDDMKLGLSSLFSVRAMASQWVDYNMDISVAATSEGGGQYIFDTLLFTAMCGQCKIITLVWHKKDRFDSKMHGLTQKPRFDIKVPSSTQKCPPQHAPVDIVAIITNLLWEIFFSNFFSNILFIRIHGEMKMKLFLYEFKDIQYHYEIWNVIIIFCLWWP